MAKLSPFPVMQFLDQNGEPLANGKVYTYAAGGPSDELVTYDDAGEGTPNPIPVVLDSAGRAPIWINESQRYYWSLTDSKDVQQWTADNIGLGSQAGDVVGDAVSTDNAIARFDGTTGKLIQNSSVTIDDTGLMTLRSLTLDTPLSLSNGGTGGATAAAARTNLGLGDLATKGNADFGDITVTNSGGTWTIDNNAVTTAKIADNSIGATKLNGEQTGSAPVYGIQGYVVFAGQSGPYSPPISITPILASSGSITVSQTDTGKFTIDTGYASTELAMSGLAHLASYSDGIICLQYEPSGYQFQIRTVTTGFSEQLADYVCLMWIGA